MDHDVTGDDTEPFTRRYPIDRSQKLLKSSDLGGAATACSDSCCNVSVQDFVSIVSPR
jgi:hypothetical protein